MLAANVLCIKKKKKKRSYHFSENLNTLSIRNDKEKGHRSTTMLHITEDTPADMLSGAMDLTIHLPSGKTTKMCVERSTPMMDLLVQITTNHQLQITNYTLQPLQISPDSSYSEKILSYYPNTPIGALDTQHVRIVPKTKTLPTQKTVPVGHQPFESTFRLKVHLPRNQLFVTRVSRHVHIGDIMRKVCEEKNLDPNKCEVRHPGNFDEVLDPKLTLNDYMITEIYLILKGSNTINQTFSANDIMNLRKEDERKHLHSKTGGGVFNLIFRRGKTNSVSTSTSAPVYNESSRSVTPPVASVQIIAPPKPETQPEKPKVPQRKRRPAPKPPIPVDQPPNDNAEGKVSSIVSDNSATSDICVKNETSVLICHSRHSSDSSGYHETSILSDHCNTSLPRRNIGLEGDKMSKNLNRHSQSIGNLSKMTEQSRSTSSLAFAGRKKKAAPPPPKFLQDSSSSKPVTQKPSPLVASQTPVDYNQSNIEISSTLGPQLKHNTFESKDTIDNVQNSINTTTTMKIEEVGSDLLCMEKRSSESLTDLTVSKEYLSDLDKYIDYRKSPQDSGNSSDISEKSKLDEVISNEDVISIVQPDKIDYETDEWQLPSPPKAFKDTTSDKLSEQLVDTSAGTVITHELLEKLRHIEEQQNEHLEEHVENNPLSETCSTISEDRPLLTNLSLENLEKRKSLVYNRELATSLKLTFDSISSPPLSTNYQPELEFPENLEKLEKTVEHNRNANQPEIEHKSKIQPTITESSLPNFKITTYDEPKRKIKVFEDDTVRSNSDSTQKKTNLDTSNFEQNKSNGRSMENISVWPSDREEVIRRPSDVGSRLYRPKSEQPRRSVNRSESFSVEQNEWSPSKPVTRSKSQVAYKKESISDKSFKSDNMLKSSSLFDVSGLQSLEVMRKIQNKLNTPTASTEALSKTENLKTEVISRKVQYTGPPSVNMSTWSERPKIPVSVKEDEDYKLGRGRNKTHSSVMINSSSEQPIENSVKIKHTTSDRLYSFSNKTETKNVTIKINGSEPISTEKNGNVLIKIRQPSSKFHEFNSDILYRHPTNGLNGSSQRPHSIAFPSDFDISRVPVVRSVELKKSFRDTSNNSSNNMSNQSKVNYIRNGYTAFSKYPSNENLAKGNQSSETITKPVFRAKSFLHPVVKGFRTLENNNGNNGENIKTRNSWQPNSSMTLPNNVSNRQSYVTNQNVPFSKLSLRKTESKKVIDDERTDIPQNSLSRIKVITSGINETKYRESNGNISHPTEIEHVTSMCKQGKPDVVGAPVPPQMPKIVHKKIINRQFVPVVNPRDELLKSIRDFGGKEGLRSIKA